MWNRVRIDTTRRVYASLLVLCKKLINPPKVSIGVIYVLRHVTLIIGTYTFLLFSIIIYPSKFKKKENREVNSLFK